MGSVSERVSWGVRAPSVSEVASTVRRVSARLHLINGDTLDVLEEPDDFVKHLWGSKPYVTVRTTGGEIHVSGVAVMYISATPEVDPEAYRIRPL